MSRGLVPVFLLACELAGCIKTPLAKVYRIDNDVPQIRPSQVILSPKSLGFSSATLSDDGRRVLVYQPLEGPAIYDVQTGQEVARIEGQQKLIGSIAWSHDGKLLATSLGRGARYNDSGYPIILWDAATMQRVREIPLDFDGLRYASLTNALAFSPDDSLLCWLTLVMQQGWKLNVMSLQSGEIASVPIKLQGRPQILFSPDSRLIYLDNSAWSIDPTPSLRLSGPRQYRIPIMAISPDGRRGYGVGSLYALDLQPVANTLGVWTSGNLWSDNSADTRREIALYELDLHTGQILSRREFTHAFTYSRNPRDAGLQMSPQGMAISPDGSRLALATVDAIHVIDLDANKDLCRLVQEKDLLRGVWSIAFFPDGHRIMGGPSAGCFIWDVP
jgi:WD40 repeat protein